MSSTPYFKGQVRGIINYRAFDSQETKKKTFNVYKKAKTC